jgi:hypothetical protein
MTLTPQSLVGNRLIATVPSASRRGVTHTITANIPTGYVWCGSTCPARGEHGHTRQMRRILADLAAIRTNQAQMGDEMLALQAEWLAPETVGFTALAWLSAVATLVARESEAA